MTTKKAPGGATGRTDAKVVRNTDTTKGQGNYFEIFEAPDIFSKDWKGCTYTWAAFVGKFKTPALASCTREQFFALDDFAQKRAKGKPYFGGILKAKEGERTTRRIKANVTARTLVTLDIDNDTRPGQWEEIAGNLEGLAAVIHTTFKSTKDAPRYRVILPTTREMPPGEWEAVTRLAANRCNVTPDDASFRNAQAMYYPTVPKDMGGDYEHHVIDGAPLDVDAVLLEAAPLMPRKRMGTSKAETATEGDGHKKDPRTIPGTVGDFCKAYSIEEAIDTFLCDIYEPTSEEGRYTFKAGSSSGGLVCYDHLFAQSYHGTDPARDELMNAFDLVRVHLHGEQDKGDTSPVGKRPSDLMMAAWCQKDPRVVQAIMQVRAKEAAADFADIVEGDDWKSRLTLDKHGNVESTAKNLALIATNDDLLQGISYDIFRGRYTTTADSPFRAHDKNEVNDTSLADISRHLENVYGLRIRAASMEEKVLSIIQHIRAFHPVKEFIERAKWDGKHRVNTLLIDYLGADDTPLNRAVTRKWMAAAVARIYEPGTKFDHVLTLAGLQGIGKSVFFRTLAGDWFNDTFTFAMDGKQQREALQGKWIVEIAELAGLRKAEVEAAKAFISSTEDNYRAAYAHLPESHPRQCVFAATTNEELFLRSVTGDRRWWVVDVNGGGSVAGWLPRLQADRAQIWSEARVIYEQGEPFYLDNKLEAEAEAVQQSHSTALDGGILGELEAWLDTPLPYLWECKNKAERARYFQMSDDLRHEGAPRRTVCVAEIRNEFNNPGVRNMTSQQIGFYMSLLPGWKREKEPMAFGVYGRARYWRREHPTEEEDLL